MTTLRRPLTAGAVTIVVTAAALVAAGTATASATAVLLALAAAVETAELDRSQVVLWARRRAEAGDATMAGLRGIAVVLVAARTAATAQLCGAAAVAVVTIAAAATVAGLEWVVRRDRRPPALTRNVRLDVDVPPAPSTVSTLTALARFAPAIAAAGFAIDATGAAATIDLALATVLAAAPAAMLAAHALRLRRGRIRAAVTAAALEAFERLQPQLLLYFAGTPREVYQLDMWLGPVERAGAPAAVLVRDHEVLARVGATALPVFCIRHNGTVAALPLAGPTVALFVTHSGNNLSLLRRPEVRSVFVGHGDSDKPDSMNPFARVYDEVWVAGPAGRRRYLDARVGVRPEAVVEVGRPQLDTGWPAPPEPFTVLYAPTWEGWGDDEHHTSLPHVGPALVQRLLAAGVRVLYRPHPLTGVRNGAVRRAHEQVLSVLRAAGAVGPDEGADSSARPATDVLDVAAATGRAPGVPHAEWQAAADARADRLIAAHADRPLLLLSDPPTLHQSFRAAHVLVTDVSSVASDWLATLRPYVMVDTRGVGSDEFRRRFPVAAGAVVLGRDLDGLDAVCDDRVAGATSALTLTREAVLGPADPVAAFRAAVQALLVAPPRRPTEPPARHGAA